MLSSALFATLLYTATALCPGGYDLVRNGECYREYAVALDVDVHKGPSGIEKLCASDDALPIIIRNQEDQDYWVGVAQSSYKQAPSRGWILLGLECNSQNRWQWADGSSVDYKPEGYFEDLDKACDNQHDAWSWPCEWTVDPISGNWQQFCHEDYQVDLYCVTAPQVMPEPDRECTEFSLDTDDDVCYQVGQTAANWTEANTICHSFGASVASIHTDKENTFLRRLAVSKGLLNGMMLGGTFDSQKNAYTWADGSDFDYNNFAPGFPVAGAGDCIAMQSNDVAGQWKNVNCKSAIPFACTRPTDANVPKCDGTLHKEGDIIYSPGFPSSASEPCDYVLQVDAGKLVEVEILFVEANNCCDHLKFFEGSDGDNLIMQISGDQKGYKTTIRTTSENVMRASWQPNGGVNVKGMMITFKGVHKKIR